MLRILLIVYSIFKVLLPYKGISKVISERYILIAVLGVVRRES